MSKQTILSSTRQANQHYLTPAGESAGQPLNRVFKRYKLTRIGVDLVTMAELMGHASLETTRLYTRPNAADMQRAVDLLTVDG